MTTSTVPSSLVRNVEEAERRWFYGGGVHTLLARASDTGDSFYLSSVVMERDKVTPLHTHPVDESFYVVDGEILIHLDGQQSPLRAGGFALMPREVPHAFKVLSESATIVMLHTPGTCEAFYIGASTPLADGEDSGPVDFDKIMESGRVNGGFTPLGPPPF